jgi:hypothetical protein
MSELAPKPFSDDILRDAPPLGYDDFEGIALRATEVEMIDEFEKLWDEYLEANPHTIPTGRKGRRIQSLQEKVEVLQLSKQKVQSELERQLDFFETAKDQLEENFLQAKAKALKEQVKVIEEVENKLEGVGSAWRNREANGPWDLFFDALEDAVEQSDVQQLPGDGISTVMGLTSQSLPSTKSNVMKPSPHAMFLNNAADESDAPVKSRDFLLRAYRIDNALLRAHVKVLQRDLEKEECTIEANQLIGKLFMEHNIFGIMSSSNQSRTGNGTVSGGTMASRPPVSGIPADE